jgi:hypothetical protein
MPMKNPLKATIFLSKRSMKEIDIRAKVVSKKLFSKPKWCRYIKAEKRVAIPKDIEINFIFKEMKFVGKICSCFLQILSKEIINNLKHIT